MDRTTRRRLIGFILGAVLVALASTLAATGWVGVNTLDLRGAASFLAGALFGWPGIVGVGASAFLRGVLVSEASSTSIGLASAAVVTQSLFAWLTFRWVPGVGRALPNLRSWLALLAAAAAAASGSRHFKTPRIAEGSTKDLT